MAEKNPKMSFRALADFFTKKFGRPVCKSVVHRTMKRKEEFLEIEGVSPFTKQGLARKKFPEVKKET